LKAKDVTIYDIARQLNISVSTVSRALNDHSVISAKTKKKVLELAERYGYQVNNFARSLRQQRTRTLGVIVPRLNSFFMASVISGIEQVAYEAGYKLIISQSSELLDREKEIAKTMFDNRVDSLLVSLTYNTKNLQHFERFFNKNIPVMFFDRTIDHKTSAKIRIDNKQAGIEATTHLIDQGCRHILHVTVSSTNSIYLERFKGFSQALKKRGLTNEQDQVFLCDLSFEAGIDAANYALSLPQRPDGIFVANDYCAAACILTLKSNGIRIPEDIAVIGFNNDPICQIVEPNLSSIQYPGHEMGEIAARSVINHLDGIDNLVLTQEILLRSGLIIRDSTRRI
jgi:LacI family transcriptional regulator